MNVKTSEMLEEIQRVATLTKIAITRSIPSVSLHLQIPSLLAAGEEELAGKEFFTRLGSELRAALSAILKANDSGLVTLIWPRTCDQDDTYRRIFDELCQRQRKLCETLANLILLTDTELFEDPALYGLYILHCHLAHNYDYWKQQELELRDYCRIPDSQNEFAQKRDATDQRITQVLQFIRPDKCTWAGKNTPATLKNKDIIGRALELGRPLYLERQVLGLSYQSLYGQLSSQLHFNVSQYHSPNPTELKMLAALEGLTLCCVCITLRVGKILELLKLGQLPEIKALDDEFAELLPNQLASGATGPADPGDIVFVFDEKKSFVGRVISLPTLQTTPKGQVPTPRLASYEIEPLVGGSRQIVNAADVMLMVPKGKESEFLSNAQKKGYLAQTIQEVINVISSNPMAVYDLVGPLDDHLPESIFCQLIEARSKRGKQIPNMPNTFLYFAYGSNMYTRRLTDPTRAPSAVAIGTGYVWGYKLTFDKESTLDKSVYKSGKCDMEATHNPNDRVWGVLFIIDRSEETALDKAEGEGHGYNKDDDIQVVTPRGRLQAVAYIADQTSKKPDVLPYHWYKAFVLLGAEEHQLPPDYIADIKSRPSQQDPDVGRRTKEEALLP